jgi:hypothetical protein
MRPAAILGLLLSALTAGCDAYVEKAKYDEVQKKLDEANKHLGEQSSFQKPTATETFNLRTKCVELAEKPNGEYDHAKRELALHMGQPPFFQQGHFSRYDPNTNRCYVELQVNIDLAVLEYINLQGTSKLLKQRDEFLANVGLDYSARYLYDGQTGEELAWMQKGHNALAPSGFIGTQKVDWSEAFTKIDETMADDPKQ